MITKPMLSGKCEDTSKLKYPVLATPKLDGIRCLIVGGKAVTRNFKPIPNIAIRTKLEKNFPDGVDGELILEGKSFQETTGAVMREDGDLPLVYYIFDYVPAGDLTVPYATRMKILEATSFNSKLKDRLFKLVLPVPIMNEKDLLAFEKKCLDVGFEGVMLRDPIGPYKCGRSGDKEGLLLKLKRFADSEAVITGFEEKMSNQNEAKKDVFGHTERSSAKEGLVPANTLGTLLLHDKTLKIDLRIGTGLGLNDELRNEIWSNQAKYLGKIVKYRFQQVGVKDLPRFPTFVGFRDKRDMSQ